jgi:hypothetical protein
VGRCVAAVEDNHPHLLMRALEMRDNTWVRAVLHDACIVELCECQCAIGAAMTDRVATQLARALGVQYWTSKVEQL